MTLIFDERQILTNGVHDASLENVEAEFAKFQKSDRRLKLFGKLQSYLAEVKRADCGMSVILDGSFVMACVDEPEDIDLILVLPFGLGHGSRSATVSIQSCLQTTGPTRVWH
jgi:hypothetical protein